MNESGAGRGCGSYGAAVTSANEQSGQQLPVGVISADRNGVVRSVELVEGAPTTAAARVVFANEAWSRLTGLPWSAILGRPSQLPDEPRGQPRARRGGRRAALGRSAGRHARTLTPHASGRAVEVELMPVLDSADELVCWVALVGAVSTAAVELGNDPERRRRDSRRPGAWRRPNILSLHSFGTTALGWAGGGISPTWFRNSW